MAVRIKPHFNCADEEWIPVLYSDGTCTKIPLKRVFKDCVSIVGICGSAITQMAVLGLLRALTYDAYKSALLNGYEWARLYKTLPNRMIEYVDSRHDDFYLYHPKNPLFQDASLTPAIVEQAWKSVAPKKEKKKKDSSTDEQKSSTDEQKDSSSTDKKKDTLSTESDKFNAVSPLILTTKPYGTASIGFTDLTAKSEYSDAELALLLLEHQFYHITDSKDVRKKPNGDYSPYLMRGGLHALFSGSNLAETIWLNIPSNDSDLNRVSGKLHLTYSKELESNKKSYANQIMPLTHRVLLSREPELNVLLVHGYECRDSLPHTWMMAKKPNTKSKSTKREKTESTGSSDIVYDKFSPYTKGNFGIRYIDSLCVFAGINTDEVNTDIDWRACQHVNALFARNKYYSDTENNPESIIHHASIKCYGVMCETKAFGQAFTGDSNMMVSDVIFDINADIESLYSVIKVCEAFSDIIYKTIDIYCESITEKNDTQRKARSMSIPGMNTVIESCRRQWWIYVDSHIEYLYLSAEKRRYEMTTSLLSAIGDVMKERNSGRDVLKTILMRNIPTNSARGCLAMGNAMNAFNAMINKIFIQ